MGGNVSSYYTQSFLPVPYAFDILLYPSPQALVLSSFVNKLEGVLVELVSSKGFGNWSKSQQLLLLLFFVLLMRLPCLAILPVASNKRIDNGIAGEKWVCDYDGDCGPLGVFLVLTIVKDFFLP